MQQKNQRKDNREHQSCVTTRPLCSNALARPVICQNVPPASAWAEAVALSENYPNNEINEWRRAVSRLLRQPVPIRGVANPTEEMLSAPGPRDSCAGQV